MNRDYARVSIGLGLAAAVLAGCSSTSPGQPTAAPPPSPAGQGAPAGGAPQVSNPLPPSVLASAPCETALTHEQVTEFIGTPDPPKPDRLPGLGPVCHWHSASGVGGSTGVTYQTEAGGGLNLAYQNVKPDAVRWQELPPIQGFPAVGYLPAGDDPNDTASCMVVAGIRDDLAYSVGMHLGDKAEKQGSIDACDAGREVADRVLTNLKARA